MKIALKLGLTEHSHHGGIIIPSASCSPADIDRPRALLKYTRPQ